MPELGETSSPETGTLPVVDVAVLAMAAAAIVVLVENGTNIANRLVLHRINGATTGFLWIVPLNYGLLFGTLAIALMVVTRLLRRRRAISLVILVTVSLASFTLLLLGLYGKVHQWALAVFALGLGVQAARIAAARGEPLLRWSRRLLVLVSPLILLPALVNPPLQRWLERRDIAHLTTAPAGAPNVLLIILDTVRATALSLYGHDRPTTPNLERLAQRGVVFDRAYSTAPWTLPSHATMFTGRYSHELTADWVIPLSREAPTMSEAFRADGYLTAGFVANPYYTQEETGLSRGFVHYEDFLHTPGQLRRATVLGQFLDTWRYRVKPARPTYARKTARVVTDQFLSWLNHTGEHPFFVFLNYFDAHEPYRRAPDWERRFSLGNSLASRYEAAIASLDADVGVLLDSLERRGLLDNTLVIITSDHGEQLGENGLQGHGNSLYIQTLHVPLMFLFANRIPAGTRVSEQVSLRDLPSTVSTLAGLATAFPGQPMTRLWSRDGLQAGSNSPILSEIDKAIRRQPSEPLSRGDMKSLVFDSLHLILNGDGIMELYNHLKDPAEADDLAVLPGAADEIARMRQLLQAAITGPTRFP